MPLINCPACSTKVSEQATSCPKCGHPLKKNQPVTVQPAQGTVQGMSGCGLFFLIVAAIIVAVILISIGE